MALSMCSTCHRHHAPSGPCPFCNEAGAAPLTASLGAALLLAAATAMGCVGTPATPETGHPALLETLPSPAGPAPSSTPATTYGLPPPPRRRGRSRA